MNRTERTIIAVGIAALVIIPAAALFLSHPTEPVATLDPNAIPVPGAPGAQHWHASLIVNIDGKAYDFGAKKYMLQSNLVHFEDDDPVTVHKHTTGVTIPYFLSTLKVLMDDKCIDFEDSDIPMKYCSNASSTLRMLVNGEEVADPIRYEIQQNDRILVYYGPERGIQLKFLWNQVPNVPEFKEKTVGELEQELRDEGYLK